MCISANKILEDEIDAVLICSSTDTTQLIIDCAKAANTFSVKNLLILI